MSLQPQLYFLLFILLISVELQQKISLTKAVEKLAIIDCQLQVSCWNYIHWYQQKDGETLKRILYADINDGSTKGNDAGDEFKSEKKGSNHFALKINKLKKEHLAMYYCACWDYNSSSTVNINTEALYKNCRVKAPTLFGYLPSKKDEKKSDGHGKQTMLCQASGMFPDLVKFAWKKKDAGKWGDVSEGDVVEQRNDGQEVTVTSMLIVDKDKARNDDYQCTVLFNRLLL
uniref:Ig-like domain-containing protein n=1 Tax=Cyprinus carpio TaxID=7962 RepID=A0A8C1WB11_CYPCA